MAINPIRFVSPPAERVQPKERKLSDIEKIIQGLQVVQAGFGIAADFTKIKGALESQGREKVAFPAQQEAFAAEEARKATKFQQDQELREGFLTPQQKLALEAKNVSFRPPQEGETPEFFEKLPSGVAGPAAPLMAEIRQPDNKMNLKVITSEAPDGTTKSMLVDISGGKLKKLDETTIKPGTSDLTVGQKLAALPSAEKNKMGYVAGAVDALNRMEQAIAKGDALVSESELLADIPIVGDRISKYGASNPATIYRRLFAEMFGRLQTGAAITKSEEERFNAILATAGDDPAAIKEKFDSVRSLLEQRIRMNDIDPNQFYQHMKVGAQVHTPSAGAAPGTSQGTPNNVDALFDDFLKEQTK